MTLDVDVDFDDLDFDDLCDYVESQGYKVVELHESEKKASELIDCDVYHATPEDIAISLADKIKEDNLDMNSTFMRALVAELTRSSKGSDPDALCAKLRELL